MEEKVIKLGTEEQLLQAREEGLRELAKANAMRAHGKVLGMDTFSWISPQSDLLATVLNSFPFAVLWVGSHDQVKTCLENYPELTQKIETIIVHDKTLLNVRRELLQKIKNIACVEGTAAALALTKSLKLKKGVLLYTTDGGDAKNGKAEFELFISPSL